jgi:hypothetical protein
MIAKLAILACLIAVSYTMAVPVEQEIAIQSNDTLMHLCKAYFSQHLSRAVLNSFKNLLPIFLVMKPLVDAIMNLITKELSNIIQSLLDQLNINGIIGECAKG